MHDRNRILKDATKSKLLWGYLLVLFISQPILDVMSYWLIQWKGEGSTQLTLAVRMLFFILTIICGFIVSKKRKVYYIAFEVVFLFWILHYINGVRIGYSAIFLDLNNYIKLVQAPLFALSFISIFKQFAPAIPAKKFFGVNYLIILFIILMAFITGTEAYTYPNYKIGIIGWFYTGNAQTAIIAMVVPIIIYTAFQSGNKIFFLLSVIVGFTNLFFTGTKVAYYSIFIISIGFVIVLLLAKNKSIYPIIIMGSMAILCAGLFTFSPMYEMTAIHSNFVNKQQQTTNKSLQVDSQSPSSVSSKGNSSKSSTIDSTTGNSSENPADTSSTKSSDHLDLLKYEKVYSQLTRYQPMIKKFGLNTVLKQTNYTLDMDTLTNARNMKLTYNFILFNQQDFLTKLLGINYNMEMCGNENYDVENDLMGILFLYGIIGFLLYMLFIGYFAIYIFKKLLYSFSQCFSVELGCILISLSISLITAIFTAGMLRSPNASFYMSALIAYAYCLINHHSLQKQVKRND